MKADVFRKHPNASLFSIISSVAAENICVQSCSDYQYNLAAKISISGIKPAFDQNNDCYKTRINLMLSTLNHNARRRDIVSRSFIISSLIISSINIKV